MTTICFDGKTLAADKQATYGNTPMPCSKIDKFKRKGKKYLIGAAGAVKDLTPIVQWIKDGEKKEEKPSVDDDMEFSVILVNENAEIKYMCNSLFWHEMGKVQWSIGSGCDYALGAMKHGASAAEAVMIAASLDVNTGLGIDTLTL